MRSKCFYRIAEVSQITGLSQSAIYKLIKNSRFPQPIRISPKCSVWSDEQLESWMEELQASAYPGMVAASSGGRS
mgnify:CR=1 FL=1